MEKKETMMNKFLRTLLFGCAVFTSYVAINASEVDVQEADEAVAVETPAVSPQVKELAAIVANATDTDTPAEESEVVVAGEADTDIGHDQTAVEADVAPVQPTEETVQTQPATTNGYMQFNWWLPLLALIATLILLWFARCTAQKYTKKHKPRHDKPHHKKGPHKGPGHKKHDDVKRRHAKVGDEFVEYEIEYETEKKKH